MLDLEVSRQSSKRGGGFPDLEFESGFKGPRNRRLDESSLSRLTHLGIALPICPPSSEIIRLIAVIQDPSGVTKSHKESRNPTTNLPKDHNGNVRNSK